MKTGTTQVTPHPKPTRVEKAPSQGLRRTGPPKPRSAKTAKLYRDERGPLVARLVEAIPVCQVCDMERSDTLHEKKFRSRGGSIVDLDNLVVIGPICHRKAHLDAEFAAKHDLAHHSWDPDVVDDCP